LALSYKINDNPGLPKVKNFKMRSSNSSVKRRGFRLKNKNKTHRTHAKLKKAKITKLLK